MINLLNWSGILNVWRRSHGFRQWLIRCAEVRPMTGFNLLSQALSFYLLDNWTVTFCVYNHLQQCERSPRPYWKYYHVSPLRQPAAFKFVIMNQYEPFSFPILQFPLRPLFYNWTTSTNIFQTKTGCFTSRDVFQLSSWREYLIFLTRCLDIFHLFLFGILTRPRRFPKPHRVLFVPKANHTYHTNNVVTTKNWKILKET